MSFDEMSSTPQLEYDVKADKIVALDRKKAGKLQCQSVCDERAKV